MNAVKTYAITMASGKVSYVCASSRESACKKRSGLGFLGAKNLGLIVSAVLCKDDVA